MKNELPVKNHIDLNSVARFVVKWFIVSREAVPSTLQTYVQSISTVNYIVVFYEVLLDAKLELSPGLYNRSCRGSSIHRHSESYKIIIPELMFAH